MMKLQVHQIYFDDAQVPHLEPAFLHYKNLMNFNRLFEQNVIESAMHIADADADAWGFASWKFRYKTNMPGEDWLRFMQDNSQADAWYMEPISVPHNPYVNPWAHGEAHHPGMMERATKICQRLGYKLDCEKDPLPLCFFSYFALRRDVWQRYLDTITEIKKIIAADPVLEHQMYHDFALYGPNSNIPFYTFFAERFITTFLKEEGIASVAMPYHNQWFVYNS